MPETYLDSSIVGFNHQDALDLKVDTYRRLSPILNLQDAPAIDENFARNLSILQEGPSNVSPDMPKISIIDALGSEDPNIKRYALEAIDSDIKSTPQGRYGLGRVIESPYDKNARKFYNKRFGYSALRDNEDFYYRNQYMKHGWFGRNFLLNPAKFLARVIPQAVMKFGQGLGYVGSMLTSVGSDNYWADVADNGFSRWFETQEEQWKDQVIPVYKQAGFDEKGFFSKLLDWSFWNDEVADAAAFMASAAIPGMAFAKLGTLGKFGAAFSATSKLGKAASTFGLGSWAQLSSWTFNTAMEASFEGAQVFKEVKNRLETEREAGLNNLSDEEIRSRAGNMAANTVAGNFAVLGLSNAWENTLFFKPFGATTGGKPRIKLADDFTASASTSSLNRLPFYGKRALQGTLAEGFWEENAQLAIQRINQNDTEGRGFFEQYFKQIGNAFAGTDREAAESIGLGALIGVGAGVGFSKLGRERRNLLEATRETVDYANKARQTLFDFNDIYERGDDNKVVYDKGKPKIDPKKMAVKQKLYEEEYGKISMASADEYFKSKPVEFETKRALANYVKSMHALGITDISSRLSSISPDNAALFGMDTSKINEQAKDFATLAESFEQVAKQVDELPESKVPAGVTPKQYALTESARKAEIYTRKSDNVILQNFVTDQNSKLLESLNNFRKLNNSSLSQFPVDQLNSLLMKKRLNKQVIDSEEFKKDMSDVEKEYHLKRDEELDKQIEAYKIGNELSLKDSKVSKSGLYTPTITDPQGNKIDVPFDTRSGAIQKNIANYENVIDKNNYIADLLADSEGYSNYEKLMETPALQQIKKISEEAKKETEKYQEYEKGDLQKVIRLVAKMLFSESKAYTPEELQLQQNYAKLIEELLPKFQQNADNLTSELVKKKIEMLRKTQASIASFITRKTEALGEKQLELEILREELDKLTNGKRADQKKIENAIDDLQRKIDFAERRISQEQDKLDILSADIDALEAELKEGNFGKLYEQLEEMKKLRDWQDTKLTEARSLLQKVKDILKGIVNVFRQLFPAFKLSSLEKILGDEVYGEKNKEAYSNFPEVVSGYEEITSKKQEKEVLQRYINQLEFAQAELKNAFDKSNADIEIVYQDLEKFYRAQYISETKAPVKEGAPSEEAIGKKLGEGLVPPGIPSKGKVYDSEDGFDGSTYQRPLHTKFFTTTFPDYRDTPISSLPQDVQDFFALLDLLSSPFRADELTKKLGKGDLRTLTVTRNNVKQLKLEKLLSERAQYFKVTDPALTHIEVIPVIEEGGYLYYVDKDLNKLGKVGDEPAKNIARRSLRTAKYTVDELAQYSAKYSKEDMDKAIKAATDWRAEILNITSKEPAYTHEFAVTRGIPNKKVTQSSAEGVPSYAKNPVIGTLVPENRITSQTVVVFSEPTQTINGENIELPVGRPFIRTYNGLHEQLHAADNQKLTTNQVATVIKVLEETLKDHLQKVTDRINKSTSFPIKLKEAITTAGGVQNLDPETKKAVYLAVTTDPSTKDMRLFNLNYTHWLSSVIYFSPLQKGKEPHENQVYVKGTKMWFGPELSIDITNPSEVLTAPVENFIASQYHNITYFPRKEYADRPYTEYYVEGGILKTRSWKNYALYLLSEDNPDGTKRSSIPVTTAVKTLEQQKAENTTEPYYTYNSRAAFLFTDAVPVVEKKITKGAKGFEQAGPSDLIAVIDAINEFYNIKGEKPTYEKPADVKRDEKKESENILNTIVSDIQSFYSQKPEDQTSIPDYNKEEDEEREGPTDEEGTLPTEGLFRVAKGGVFKTEKDLDEVIADIQRMLPQFPVQRLKKTIKLSNGLEAWGQFVDNVIKLYELAEEGTGYHEAFEAVVNRLLSDAEWRAIYKEFASRKGSFLNRETGLYQTYSSANPHQAKEQLAEEFRDFKLGKKNPEQKQTRSFFQIIWDFIKSLFRAKPTIEDIFNKIDKGKFANVAARNSDRFAINYRILKGLPVQVRRDLFEGATAFMFRQIFYSPDSLTSLDEIEETDDSIYEPIRMQFINTIEVLNARLKKETNEENKKKYVQSIKYINYSLENWKEFVSGHKEFLKPFRIRFQQDPNLIQAFIREEPDESRNRNDYLQDIFKTDGKRSASKSIRFLFGTLLQLQFERTGTTNVVNGRTAGKIEVRPNSVFMSSLVNYDEFMLKALKEFEGMHDFSRVEARLVDLSGINEIEQMENPEAQSKMISSMGREKAIWTSLYMRLFGFSDKISEEAAWNLKVKFSNYVGKHAPNPWVFLSSGGGTSTFISSVKRGFYETMMRRIESSIITHANLVFRRTLKEGVNIFLPIPEFTKKLTAIEFTPQRMDRFIQFLGLYDKDTKQGVLSPEFIKALSRNDKASLTLALLRIRNALTNAETPTLNLRQLNIFGYVSKLIDFLDAKSGDVLEKGAQFFNIENEPQQRHITPSFVSRFFSELNNIKTLQELKDKYPHLEGYFSENSLVLRKLFDENGNRNSEVISLDYTEGVKDLDEQEGSKISSLEYPDLHFLHFNSVLEGRYPTLPADSETEWIFNFGEFVAYSENIMGERGDEIIKEIFIPKLKNEMDMIISNLGDLAQHKARHKEFDREIGKSLRFFKDILQYTSKGKDKSLVNDIHKALDEGMTPARVISKYNARIKNAIRTYLKIETDKAILELTNNRILMNDGKDYQIQSLSNDFVDRYSKSFSLEGGLVVMTPEQMRSLFEYQKINSIIGNMEAFQIVYGDPAQYKDWEKRAKSFLGPVEQTYYDSTGEFNNWLNKNKNSAVLGDEKVELSTTDWFRTDFGDFANARTVNDLSVAEVDTVNDLIDRGTNFAKRYISDYENVNEADGQSIGTIGFARHLFIKSGWRWTKEHENFYQYDTALMRQELSKEGIYSYKGNPELKAMDEKIVAYYEKNPPLALLSPAKTLMPYIDENGNHSLLKHSIHFVSYQVAKEFEMLDWYVDMLRRNDQVFNFKSVQKVGLRVDNENKITDYYSDPFTANDMVTRGNPQSVIDLRTVGVQVETQSESTGQTLGSQLTKLINLNLSDTGVPTDFLTRAMKGGATKSEVIKYWNALSEEEKLDKSDEYFKIWGPTGTLSALENLKVRNSLDKFTELGVRWSYAADGGFSYSIDDLTKIVEYIKKELQRLEVDENTINNIQLTEDLKAFVNPAETIPSYTTIANLLWSMADAAVTSMKVNGKPLIQVASTFFNKDTRKAAYKGEDGKWVVVDNKEDYDKAVAEGKKMVMTSSELKFYTLKKDETGKAVEINAMEVYLPNIYKRKVNEVRKKKGLPALSDAELMAHLNKNPKLLEGIGFRIPTQATSSLEFFRIKGFLPEIFGNAVVVPSAIVTKAGSDFDVDKLSTYLNNFKLDSKGMPYYEEYKDDDNSTPEERYVAYVRSHYKEYKAVRQEMLGSDEYKDVAMEIEENEQAIRAAKSLIGDVEFEQEETYKEGYRIFSQLPWKIKQFYFDEEAELTREEIGGEEKILHYLHFTKRFIKTLEADEAIQVVVKHKKDDKIEETKEIITADEAVPTMRMMIENYSMVLKQMGITQEVIDDYLAIKDEKRDANSSVVRAFNFKLASLIAEFNDMVSFDEFAELPMYLQNTKGALQNVYFESIRNVLKSPEMFEVLLSPNSISHIRNNRDIVQKAIDPEWEAEDKKDLDYTNYISTEYIAKKRNQFLAGKRDIGIGAVGMTNFANTQVTGVGISSAGSVKASDSNVFDTLNNGNISLPFEDIDTLLIDDSFFISISSMRDRTGALTMDKLSSYINGFVDVAKEPYIIEMGMHRELAGSYLLLERMGLSGKTTALFMYQPAVREFLRELIFFNKSYFANSPYQTYKELLTDLVEKYGGTKNYDPDFRFTDNVMENMIRKGELVKQGKVEWTEEEKQVQYMALVTFLKLRMYSQHLLESVQASNHDTASVRSPYIIMKKDLTLERAVQGNIMMKPNGDMGFINGAKALRDGTSIKTDVKMLKEFNNLFAKIGLFSLQRSNPQAALFAVAGRIFKDNPFISNDEFVSLMREYEAAIIDSMISKVLVPGIKETDVVYNALYRYAHQYFRTDSPSSLKKRWIALKRKYPRTFKKNFFLANLEINTDEKLGVDLLELTKKPGNTDVITKEMITEGMLQLAEYNEDDFPDLVQFYRGVVYGAILQYGIKYSRKSFVDLIPVSAISDITSPLSLTDITKPALQNIDTEDFSTLDELVQRSRWYKKGVVPEKTQMSMHFVSPDPTNPTQYVLERAPVWRFGQSKPPAKSSQVFFARKNKKGDIVPHIFPALIWGGYTEAPTKWEDMPNIIKIPAVRPEYITAIERASEYGTTYVTYKVSDVVKSMMKRGDYSYMFHQEYKKVGVEDPSLGRAFVGKRDSKGRQSISYLYKPINKYGSRDFNEIKPLFVTSENSVVGEKSILEFPPFRELNDEELVLAINNKDGRLQPITQPIAPILTKVYKPIAAGSAEEHMSLSIDMTPDNIVKIAQGKKTATVRTPTQAGKIRIPTGETQVRLIGGTPYRITNRGYLTVQQAGGLKKMLESEGVDVVNALKFEHARNWIQGKGKLYVYDIAPAEEGEKPPSGPTVDDINKLPCE